MLTDIANFVCDYRLASQETMQTAGHGTMNTLGSGLPAISYPTCNKAARTCGPRCRQGYRATRAVAAGRRAALRLPRPGKRP